MTVRELLDGYDTLKNNTCINIVGIDGKLYYYGDVVEIRNDDDMWKDEEVISWSVEMIEDGNGLYDSLEIVVKAKQKPIKVTSSERKILMSHLKELEEKHTRANDLYEELFRMVEKWKQNIETETEITNALETMWVYFNSAEYTYDKIMKAIDNYNESL